MNLFLDTETTGHWDFKSPTTADHQPHIVQIAAMLLATDGNTIAGAMNFIIEPAAWDISAEVVKVHHISKDLAMAVGIPRKVALAAFNHLLKHSRRLVAHNLAFDFAVMEAQFAREGQQMRMNGVEKICTMNAATPVLKLPKGWVGKKGDEWKWPSLTETYQHYFPGEDFEDKHNAQGDLLALIRIFNAMVKAGHLKP